MNENTGIVEQVYALLGKEDWDGLAALYQDDVVVEWPQSGERLRGKEACLEVFRNYPGGAPQMQQPRVVGSGELVVGQADIVYPDGSTWKAIGIFEIRDGKIAKETDYFTEPFEAPEWRAHLVDIM